MSKITLGATPDFTVPLPDPATDAERVYRPRVQSKSVTEKWQDAWFALLEYEEKQDESKKPTAAETKKYMRLMCDCLSLLLTGGESSQEAGDHLMALWESDTEGVTVQTVGRLLQDVLSASNPPT